MALAPVAVEMGPRNRRRLTAGTVSVALIGATVASLLLLFDRSPGHPEFSSVRPATTHAPTARLIFGMTEKQVRHRTGEPAAIQASCWVFHPNKTGMVGSVSVQPSFATTPYEASTTGALKVCFSGGLFSYGQLRMLDKQNHKWIWAPWPLALSPRANPRFAATALAHSIPLGSFLRAPQQEGGTGTAIRIRARSRGRQQGRNAGSLPRFRLLILPTDVF
jgi:hypothetical protein